MKITKKVIITLSSVTLMLFMFFMSFSQGEISLPAAQLLVLGQGGSNFSYPYLLRADGSSFHNIFVEEGSEQLSDFIAMACSADGTYIIFSAGQLYKMNSDGLGLELISSNGFFSAIALSPDNSQLAFSGIYVQPWYSVTPAIFIMDIDGSNLVKLTQNTFVEEDPTWSPDGQQIAFIYDDNGTRGIATVNTDGSNLQRVTEGSAYTTTLDWSPDGEDIAFSSHSGGEFDNFNLYNLHLSTAVLTQLTPINTGNNTSPQWSPDGNFIGFNSDRDDDEYEIYRMNADGTNPVRLTETIGDNYAQCWLNPTPPIANAGADRNINDFDNNGEVVTLNGSASTDSDGTVVSYSWKEGGIEIATGVNPSVGLTAGVHTITLTVTDDDGLP